MSFFDDKRVSHEVFFLFIKSRYSAIFYNHHNCCYKKKCTFCIVVIFITMSFLKKDFFSIGSILVNNAMTQYLVSLISSIIISLMVE